MECIGKGGMGMVFRASDTRLRAQRAIKLMRLPDSLTHQQAEGLRNRLIQEAQAAQALAEQTHHVVRVFDVGLYQEDPYLVMEYLAGSTLADCIDNGPLEPNVACDMAYQVIKALNVAHDQGMVHRDLKPENIMIIQRDGANFCKLLDFGLVKTNESLVYTQSGMVMGTLNYMAPEQIKGEAVSPATDIYAFGGVFYEALTGVRSNPGKTQSALLAVLLDKGPLPMKTHRSDLPTELADLLNRCLRLDVTQRPSTVEVLDILSRYADGGGTSVPVHLWSTMRTTPFGKFSRPALRWTMVALPLLLVLVLMGYLFTMNRQNPAVPAPGPSDLGDEGQTERPQIQTGAVAVSEHSMGPSPSQRGDIGVQPTDNDAQAPAKQELPDILPEAPKAAFVETPGGPWWSRRVLSTRPWDPSPVGSL